MQGNNKTLTNFIDITDGNGVHMVSNNSVRAYDLVKGSTLLSGNFRAMNSYAKYIDIELGFLIQFEKESQLRKALMDFGCRITKRNGLNVEVERLEAAEIINMGKFKAIIDHNIEDLQSALLLKMPNNSSFSTAIAQGAVRFNSDIDTSEGVAAWP